MASRIRRRGCGTHGLEVVSMEQAIEFLTRHGYAVIFGWVLGEQLGLPVPAEPMLLGAGALVGLRRLDPGAVVVFAALGSLLADTAWYVLGRVQGGRVLGWLCRITLEPDSCVRKTEDAFGRHGARVLLFAKFVPGLNTVAPPLAGIVGMPVGRFLVCSAIGGLVWAGAFVGLGFALSDQLERVAAQSSRLGAWMVVILALALAVYLGAKFVARQRFLRKLRIARIEPAELKARLDGGEAVMIVDLRHALDFEAEPSIIPGALHLTTAELEARHREIPRDREIVLYCT
jgi:membrane protein DedA with SNARE-associated domain